jgi:hypothetical protein
LHPALVRPATSIGLPSMKSTFLALVLVALCTSFAAAQQPAARGQDVGQQLTPAVITPDMWYYSQEQRRHDDPQQAVRRKAEQVSEQRAARIAAMKWYGMSNARPAAAATPWMGVYSPAWVGNGYDRYDWVGLGSPHTARYVSPTLIIR